MQAAQPLQYRDCSDVQGSACQRAFRVQAMWSVPRHAQAGQCGSGYCDLSHLDVCWAIGLWRCCLLLGMATTAGSSLAWLGL